MLPRKFSHEGESIIDDLTEADMELELGQIEVNDAHLAHLVDALAGLSNLGTNCPNSCFQTRPIRVAMKSPMKQAARQHC